MAAPFAEAPNQEVLAAGFGEASMECQELVVEATTALENQDHGQVQVLVAGDQE